MKKQFVTYEIALKLKELGFDEPCLYSFEFGNGGLECKLNPNLKSNTTCDIGEITAPLWQQAIEFLLKGLHQKYPYIHIMYVNPNEYSILMEQPKDTFTGRDYVDYGVNSIEELVLKMIELY